MLLLGAWGWVYTSRVERLMGSVDINTVKHGLVLFTIYLRNYGNVNHYLPT